MPKAASFTVSQLPNGAWRVNIPARAAADGKKHRKNFATKTAAEKFGQQMRVTRAQQLHVATEAAPGFIADALHLDRRFKELGFRGLMEGCESILTRLTEERSSPVFRQLLNAYQADYPRVSNRAFNVYIEECLPVGLFDQRVLPQMTKLFWVEVLDGVAKTRGWNAKTRNDVRNRLSAIFRHAVKHGTIKENPLALIRQIEAPPQEVRVLEPEQLRKILAHCVEHRPRLVLAYALMSFAGLRPMKELTNLRWSDVIWEQGKGGILRVRDTKNEGKTRNPYRFVSIHPTLATWLRAYAPAPTPKGGELGGDSTLVHNGWRHMHKNMMPKLGIVWSSGDRDRDIARHSFGSYLLASGVPTLTVMDEMGQRRRHVFERHYMNRVLPSQAKEYWALTYENVAS